MPDWNPWLKIALLAVFIWLVFAGSRGLVHYHHRTYVRRRSKRGRRFDE